MRTKRRQYLGFVKYQHIERVGTSGVRDIEFGRCFIFPKIDGTNASCWKKDGEICGGSRNRKLSLENDNAGFYANILDKENIEKFFEKTHHRRSDGWNCWSIEHRNKHN